MHDSGMNNERTRLTWRRESSCRNVRRAACEVIAGMPCRREPALEFRFVLAEAYVYARTCRPQCSVQTSYQVPVGKMMAINAAIG